jgi:glycine/D-amino acid oxidase-like deaminating enzyme
MHLAPGAGAGVESPVTSLWTTTAGPTKVRPSLRGDLTVDVAVIGAGYTGLWTAYYVASQAPDLRIAVIDAQTVGFGASGRNGGWCSATLPMSSAMIARRHGPDAAKKMREAMIDTVDEVGRIARRENIDCHYAKGGSIVLARTPVQLQRASQSEDEVLSAMQTSEYLNATRVLGATYTPHCAALHPLLLVRGLAAACERRGVKIFEHTPAVRLKPNEIATPGGTIRATSVVRATEAYTARLRGHRRDLIPLYTLMVATPPLPVPLWDEIGLRRRETFADYRHLIIYGQRTHDNRLVIGGRGAPYHFGSAIKPGFDQADRVFARLRGTLGDMFPALGRVRLTHRWGGPLGVSRDWTAYVGEYDGIYAAGGYVGDGVAAANLAGRTLADMILQKSTALTSLPWVGHQSRKWAPEPLRWLGVNTAVRMISNADAEEAHTRRPSRRAAVVNRLIPR